MSFHKLLHVSIEEHIEIKRSYGKSDDEIKKLIKIIRKWIQTQPHLPQDQDEYFLEMMLKLNKFDEEKAKKKIDMYYTVRHVAPDFYENRSLNTENMKLFMDTLMILPLPQLTPSMERIYLVKYIDTNPSNYDILSNARYLFSLFDVRLKHDAACAEQYIVDLSGLRFGHVLKVNIMMVKKIYIIMEKAYSDKIKGLHFLNVPMIGNALINISKLVLSQKLANRVHTHKDFDSLTNIIPAKLLPCDYNGAQKSSEILYKNWRKEFEKCNDWLIEQANKKTNEELRLESTKHNTNIFNGIFNMFHN